MTLSSSESFLLALSAEEPTSKHAWAVLVRMSKAPGYTVACVSDLKDKIKEANEEEEEKNHGGDYK
jgi:hypothetical protein